MHSLILTGVLDYRPHLAICRSGLDLRGALAEWFGDLVPGVDFLEADPEAIEGEIDEAMAPSDWTALVCFPLVETGLAFTGEAIGVALALQRFAEDEPPTCPAGGELACPTSAGA